MRASRLVSVLLLLQTRGRLTADTIAAELEVSPRTVYRDVRDLQAAGIPIYGDAGPAGGYRLVDGYRTRLTGLTGPEAESLFLTALPGPAADLGLGELVAAAQLKLMAALPPDLRDRAGRISARFHLDAPGWYRGAPTAEHLTTVADAVWTGRRLHVRYQRWRAPEFVERTLDPYGLVLKAGTWYLVAAGDTGRVATYKVASILAATPTGEASTRPDDFDLATHWRSYVDDFDARRHRGTADLRIRRRALDRLGHLLGDVVARSAARSTGPDPVRGWVRVRIPIESTAHAHGELLRLGADVEVLAPPDLRASLAATVQALATVYTGQ